MDNNSPLLKDSDKSFHHKYLPFYEEVLKGIDNNEAFDIFEIGVFNGKSIKFWNNKYPKAKITGADIISPKEEWPKGKNIEYITLDQSRVSDLQLQISKFENLKIIIDDGSHQPIHQLIFLHLASKELQFNKSGKRVLILEDIQTSLRRSIESRNIFSKFKNELKEDVRWLLFAKRKDPLYWDYAKALKITNSLGLILSCINIKNGKLSKKKLVDNMFTNKTIQSVKDIIIEVIDNILNADKISIYKRAEFPEKCWHCGEELFDSMTLRCISCGFDVYQFYDSMTISLEFK